MTSPLLLLALVLFARAAQAEHEDQVPFSGGTAVPTDIWTALTARFGDRVLKGTPFAQPCFINASCAIGLPTANAALTLSLCDIGIISKREPNMSPANGAEGVERALEARMHRIVFEPWVGPFVTAEAPHILRSSNGALAPAVTASPEQPKPHDMMNDNITLVEPSMAGMLAWLARVQDQIKRAEKSAEKSAEKLRRIRQRARRRGVGSVKFNLEFHEAYSSSNICIRETGQAFTGKLVVYPDNIRKLMAFDPNAKAAQAFEPAGRNFVPKPKGGSEASRPEGCTYILSGYYALIPSRFNPFNTTVHAIQA
ncbi:hypothetical protein K438DRAFT_1784498 [Mycena galopus ATCC 62051]|nr:hypothetical protein K438DRAFT_1784498 [Mycena galopus ATCC 62051]